MINNRNNIYINNKNYDMPDYHACIFTRCLLMDLFFRLVWFGLI